VFTCAHCNAVPEQVVDGKAAIAIVRHKLGCPTLLAQTRTRWPAQVRSAFNLLGGRVVQGPLEASDVVLAHSLGCIASIRIEHLSGVMLRRNIHEPAAAVAWRRDRF
jgi:predicted alpha/beta hydrolase family esterase